MEYIFAVLLFATILIWAFRSIYNDVERAQRKQCHSGDTLSNAKHQAQKRAAAEAEYNRKVELKRKQLLIKQSCEDHAENIVEDAASLPPQQMIQNRPPWDNKTRHTWRWEVLRLAQLKAARDLPLVSLKDSTGTMVAEFESSPDRETGEIRRYKTTLHSCQCRDFVTRNAKVGPCKHIISLAIKLNIIDMNGQLLLEPSSDALQSTIIDNTRKEETRPMMEKKQHSYEREAYLTIDDNGNCVFCDEYGVPLQDEHTSYQPNQAKKPSYFDGKLVAFAGHIQGMTQAQAAEEVAKRGGCKSSPAYADVLVLGTNPPVNKIVTASKAKASMIDQKEFLSLLNE